MSDDGVIHVDVRLTGERDEDKSRRLEAMAQALGVAVSDPQILVRISLGRAYSDFHQSSVPLPQIVEQLRDLYAEQTLHEAARSYQARLCSIVAARTSGERCGDYIAQFQLQLLSEVLNLREPDDATR